MTAVHAALASWIGEDTLITDLTYSESGGNIFIDELPESPDEAVLMAAGYGFGTESDVKLPYDAFHIQIVVRGTSNPDWALARWVEIYNEIHGLRNTQLDESTYLVFAVVQSGSPIRLGSDDKGRHRYSMNIRGETLRG